MSRLEVALVSLVSAVAFASCRFGKLSFEAGVSVTTLLFVRFAIASPCCGRA
jgi:hypothetical protein